MVFANVKIKKSVIWVYPIQIMLASNLLIYCSFSGCQTWCKLAYWEESTRVGRQFPVSSSTVDVFSTLPKGNGLCLSSLFDQNKKPTESTSRTRDKIGQGKPSIRLDRFANKNNNTLSIEIAILIGRSVFFVS